MESPTDSPDYTKHDDSICIEDFCGYTSPGHYPISFSADYFPAERLTHFTGDWGNIPPMPSNTAPTEKQVWEWAETHGWKI
jgi:hypothetical protein